MESLARDYTTSKWQIQAVVPDNVILVFFTTMVYILSFNNFVQRIFVTKKKKTRFILKFKQTATGLSNEIAVFHGQLSAVAFQMPSVPGRQMGLREMDMGGRCCP